MTFVRSWDDVQAPERYDTVEWTVLQIQEGATDAGPWALIDEQPWTTPPGNGPVDITTDEAAVEGGWYRVRWGDDTGAFSSWTDPIMDGAGDGPIGGKVVSVAEFAAYLGRPSLAGSSLTEALAVQHIIAAEELVESRISYELAPIDEIRALYVGGESVVRLPGGLTSATTIETDTGVPILENHYRLLGIKRRPAHLLLGIPWGTQAIYVTGTWGLLECPPSLKNAICAIAARDHFQRLNRHADITQNQAGDAQSYFDRIPTVASQAIREFVVPGV